MNNTPSLLLITWNRSAYLEKMLANLLADPADFRVYWWDNASEDPLTRHLFETTKDERIVVKRRHHENVAQREPCLWFFENAASDIVGKIDDDVLLPHGWTDRITPMLRAEPRFGMLGCWLFMPEEWDEEKASHSIVELSGYRVWRGVSFAGCAFLARKQHLLQHITPPGPGYGLPIDRAGLTRSGLVNGKPLPILFAQHMEDPLSPHCLLNDGSMSSSELSLTMRKRGFASVEDYSAWIREDAKRALEIPFDVAFREHLKKRRTRSFRKAMRLHWLHEWYNKLVRSFSDEV